MKLSTLARTGAAVAATALTGGLASQDVNTRWYKSLDKPSFQPPPVAFPVVWTALYADVAVASASVIEAFHAGGRNADATAYQRALGLNLVLNGSWTWVFFRAHRLGPATLVAGALAVSCVDLARRADQVSRPAAVALVPYAAWCAFATFLSASLWRRNR